MPDSNVDSQNDTGEKNDGADDGNGASKDAQVERLRRERDEWKEKASKLEQHLDNDDDSSNEQESFYREKEGYAVTQELKDVLKDVPEKLRASIEADPFNKTWTDPKLLKYELLDCKDPNDPKQMYDAAKRAAIKSIPEYVKDFVPAKTEEDDQGVGNNPPLDQKTTVDGKKDLWQYTDEELMKLRKTSK